MFRSKKIFLGVALSAALSVALLVAGCGTASTAQVPLKYSYKAGDSWTQELTTVLNGKIEGAGMTSDRGTLPKDTTAKMRITATVKDVTNGIATLVYKYQSLDVSTGGTSVDAAAKTLPDMTVKVDQTGKTVSIEGLDQLSLSGLSGSSGSGLPIDPSQLTNGFSVPFPKDGLATVGEEWSDTTRVPIPGTGQEIVTKSSEKLISLENQGTRTVADIAFKVAVPLDLTLDLGALMKAMVQGLGGAGTATTQALDLRIIMKGAMTVDGTALVDASTGRSIGVEGTVKMNMTMEFKGSAQGMSQLPQGPMKMDMTETIKITGVPKQ